MSLSLGLMSGTSMDGIDAALVELDPAPGARPLLLGYSCCPYPHSLRQRLLAMLHGAGSLSQLAALDFQVGGAFAEAALGLLDELSVKPAEVRCIGSHGQTLLHLPRRPASSGSDLGATLQIGEPAVIAARTGIVTVADFRRMDMAVGGQGAPLVPLLDLRLYASPGRGRVLLNLGGIANLTVLPAGAGAADLIAFDVGPANVLLDAVARQREVPGGYDRDGDLAAAGRVDQALLSALMGQGFYRLPPPRSADIGEFLEPLHEQLLARGDSLSTVDLLATLTELTARTIFAAITEHALAHHAIHEVLVSGGGVHNRTLMRRLADLLAPLPLAQLPDDTGIPADAKEAVAFALLAVETLEGRPGNVPAATGARQSAVLGKVVSPPTGQGLPPGDDGPGMV